MAQNGNSPHNPRFKLIRRSEQRLARHDVDVYAGLLIVPVLCRFGPFGAALLRYAILLR